MDNKLTSSSEKSAKRVATFVLLATLATVSTTAQSQTKSNSRPQAVDDQATVRMGAELRVVPPGVLRNDTDADQDALNVPRVVEGPTNGVLNMQPDGSFSYKPNKDFVGADAFTYLAHDGTAESEPATVRIVVRPRTRANSRE